MSSFPWHQPSKLSMFNKFEWEKKDKSKLKMWLKTHDHLSGKIFLAKYLKKVNEIHYDMLFSIHGACHSWDIFLIHALTVYLYATSWLNIA